MRSVKFSDEELLHGLISRDERILREYYIRFYQGIRRFILSNNGNNDDARDIFQEVMLVMYQKVRNKEFGLTCALSTYLYSVCRLIWLKELGKRKWISHSLNENDDFVDTDTDISDIHEKNERLILFRKCFEKLSENCKKVLSLFNQGLSITEITRLMGYRSEQHTKNRRYRCKMSLIESIKAEYNYNSISYGNNTPD